MRPLAALRGRGVEIEIILLDAPAFASQERRETGRVEPIEEVDRHASSARRCAPCATRSPSTTFAWHTILPMEPISGQLDDASATGTW